MQTLLDFQKNSAQAMSMKLERIDLLLVKSTELEQILVFNAIHNGVK